MGWFLDVYSASLNKTGEELCGDKVKTLKTESKTLVVMSDGLGSGVKANILATLTAEIIITMLRADVPLKEVIATVIGTLPICRVRKVAYATFTIVEIDHATNCFKVTNFDNPPVVYVRGGRSQALAGVTEQILNRSIHVAEGCLERGDFLAVVSDGVLHAGLGTTLNFGWGWDNLARHIEQQFLYAAPAARLVVEDIIRETRTLYGSRVGDDATCVGILVRDRHSLIVFTGPPLNESADDHYIERVLNFDGRKVVCGGTTGNLVAAYLGEPIRTDLATLREDVPPIGVLPPIDLLTEGIITMARAMEYMRDSQADPHWLPRDRNGAVLLARELLSADSIFFLVGQKINEFYQNPLLPRNLSIRKNLVEEIAAFLRQHQKEVRIEYC